MKKIILFAAAFICTAVFLHADEILIDGIKRTYSIHIPSEYAGKKIPLLFALHGGGGNGKGMKKLTGFDDYADRYGFAVVYPDGIKKQWNDRREVNSIKVNGVEVNDVKFLTVLADTLVMLYGLDSGRIYTTGISNGGFMSFLLVLEHPDKFKGAAVIAASMTPYMLENYKNAVPMPLLLFFGDEDPLVPYEGGEIEIIKKKRGKVIPVDDAVKFWIKVNKCSLTPELTLTDEEEDNTGVEKYYYSGGEGGADFIFYKIRGGGHTWPCGWAYLPEFIIGRTSQEINASDEILKFFSGLK